MSLDFTIEPIGFVSAARNSLEDDFWGGELAGIKSTGLGYGIDGEVLGEKI